MKDIPKNDHRVFLEKMKAEYKELIENCERLLQEKEELATLKKKIVEERDELVKRTVERKKLEMEKKRTEPRRTSSTGNTVHSKEKKCTRGLWDWKTHG
jgi:cell division septum initiation protein DivIVA